MEQGSLFGTDAGQSLEGYTYQVLYPLRPRVSTRARRKARQSGANVTSLRVTLARCLERSSQAKVGPIWWVGIENADLRPRRPTQRTARLFAQGKSQSGATPEANAPQKRQQPEESEASRRSKAMQDTKC